MSENTNTPDSSQNLIQDEQKTVTETTQNIENTPTDAPVASAVETPAPAAVSATEQPKAEAAPEVAAPAPASTDAPAAPAESAATPAADSNADIADKAMAGVTAEATAKMEEALKAEPTAEELAAREETARIEAANKEETLRLYQEYKAQKGNGETIAVNVIAKIRGGLRVEKDGFQMFLPSSLLSSARVEDSELEAMIGQSLSVEVADADDDRQSIVVSRKALVEKEAWGKLNEGDIVKGKVSSVPGFGVFVNLGGVEGLLHVSRISHRRVENPAEMFKKGDEIEVKIIELNQSKGKISLSRKELEESPWNGAAGEFAEGSTHKGQVKNLTNFGMYVEMKPGVEGLIRMNELSWTRRARLEDTYKTGDEVEFYVMNVNEDKGQADLSIKRLTTDPWSDVAEKYKIGDNYQGKVNEIVEKGVRITVNGEVDAFMPKGRMRSVLKNGVIPYVPEQEVEVTVIDLDTEKHSMILSPKGEGQGRGGSDRDGGGGDRRGGGGGRRGGKSTPIPKEHDSKQGGSFSLGDMLGNLFGGSDDEKK